MFLGHLILEGSGIAEIATEETRWLQNSSIILVGIPHIKSSSFGYSSSNS